VRLGGLAGHSILKLGDTERMFVTAEVYETDARRVSPGQSAVVTSKAFAPGQRVTGTVKSISALVHKKDVLSIDPAADADARVLEARNQLSESALAARYNHMQVDVTIDVGR
jgi:HlyD family secretion protein